jgi:hypothetical protein
MALDGYAASKLFPQHELTDVWRVGQEEMATWLLGNNLRLQNIRD